MKKLKIEEKYLTPNKYSRPRRPLKGEVKAVVMHWVANPMTSALANWSFFDSRQYGGKGYGGAHYIVGLNGEIIHAIPDDEMAYHVGSKEYTDFALKKLGTYPNNCTIGIEMCHIDWDGEFTSKTLASAAHLAAILCRGLNLDPLYDVITHHEVVGWKDCPRWFTNNEDEYEVFILQVDNYRKLEEKKHDT